jgi:hypothetical protein
MHKLPADRHVRIPEAILSLREIRLYSAEADVAEPTFKRALRGQRCQPASLRRIRQVLAARGLVDVLPPQPAEGGR